MNTAGPRTSAFCRALMPSASDCPPHLLTVALHEAGHLTMALLSGVVPCRARVFVDDAGNATGSVCWRCHPAASHLAPRRQALISAAGAAAGQLHLDAGDDPALVSDKDAAGITDAGLKADDAKLMREARETLSRHQKALTHCTLLLARHRSLTREEITRELETSRHLQSVREVLNAAV